jgi:hypothetical protein
VQNSVEDQQALEFYNRLWHRFCQQLRNRLPKVEFTQEQVVALTKFAGRYRWQINEAFGTKVEALEVRGGLLFSDLPAHIVLRGIAEAVRVLAEHPENSKMESVERTVVKNSVIRTIDEYLTILDEWLSHAEPRQLLIMLLHTSQPTAEKLIDRITFEQAYKVLWLHIAAVTGRKYFSYKPPPGQEPKNALDWLARRLYKRISSELQKEPGLFFWTTDRPYPAKNGSGEPLNLANPLNAQIIQKWDREMNKHGRLKGDQHAKGRIATPGRISDSLPESTKAVRRYLQEDIPATITPNGKGGVDIKVTDEGILASIEAVAGKKPGRRSKHPL